MHLSDSRLASSRKGFRFSGLEMIGMKEEKKVERGVMDLQTQCEFTQSCRWLAWLADLASTRGSSCGRRFTGGICSVSRMRRGERCVLRAFYDNAVFCPELSFPGN